MDLKSKKFKKGQTMVEYIIIPSLPLENLKIAFPPKPACVFRLRAS